MIARRASLILTARILAVATGLALPGAAQAQCIAQKEEGRWHNLDSNGDPEYIDVKTVGGCGDEVANGHATGSASRYRMQAWVKQQNGTFYGRPPVSADYRLWKGAKWLVGKVPTGGYVDGMWLHVEPHDGKEQLHVFIEHQSLDSKPNAQSEYWYAK